MRAAKPDGRTIALTNFKFERDVFTFTLNGKLHLLTAVDGKTPGAVFIGQGSYQLDPATPAERMTLGLHSGKKDFTTLNDTFDSAIFLGTALPLAAEKASAPAQEAASPQATDRWNDYMKKQKKDLHTNLHVRVLQELVDGGEPFFFSWLDGKSQPASAIIVDPRGAEAVRLVNSDMGGEQSMLFVRHDTKGGIWYSSRYRSEVEKGAGPRVLPPADAHHYHIDSTIRGAELDATTTMTFTPNHDLRVLPIDITASLALASAEFAPAGDTPQWTAVAFIQEKDDPDAAVVFPAALKKGEKYLLRTKYSGKEVLDNAGDGNFTVTRRTNWYPNIGVFNDLATYELRFRTPEKFSIVSVGNETENRVEGADRIATWKATHPIRVAGFNYGKFKKMAETDKVNGTTFEVYTNTGTPDIIREINQFLRAANDAAMAGDEEASRYAGSEIRVDAASLAQSAMADGMNTVRTGNVFFGPLADSRVAITQQSQWFSGQSWPTLIYLPYLAFLNGTQRNTLGLNDARDFVNNVGTHEVAHQWWGHQVGTRSYHDEWISEGFSEFTSALVLQQTSGWAHYNAFWERARKSILEKPRGAQIANNEAGPISQGWRVGTWQNPGAYGVVIYSKGAYVLHMLRMAMWDNQKGDEAFIRMMKEFATTYAGKEATTADFQRVVEKHAPPVLRLTSDNKLDWFFSQWVYGMPIPKYDAKIEAKDIGGGKYKVSGAITQSGVPDNFAMPVPIYVHFDKTNFVRLGSTVVVGNTSKQVDFEIALPKKPVKFTVNQLHDILAR
ncbi:MAG TPA: M1 family aminopeptidase [Thermoanaerobaculia bacterium]